MKKKRLGIIALTTMIFPELVMATDYIICGDNKKIPYDIANIMSTFLTLLKILIPILMIISGMIAFFKATASSHVDEELKKAKSKLINNIIAAIIVFLSISIIGTIVNFIAGKGNNLMECVECFIEPEKCAKTTEDDELKPRLMNDDLKNQTKTDDKTNSQVNNQQDLKKLKQ